MNMEQTQRDVETLIGSSGRLWEVIVSPKEEWKGQRQ
jgi:hypothetical protein